LYVVKLVYLQFLIFTKSYVLHMRKGVMRKGEEP